MRPSANKLSTGSFDILKEAPGHLDGGSSHIPAAAGHKYRSGDIKVTQLGSVELRN